MGSTLKFFILFCGLLFSGFIVRLLLKKKINERNSLAWLACAIAILLVSANPQWLDELAGTLGVSYPPALLFLFSTLVLLALALYQSMQISVLNEKLRQVAQQVALQDEKRRSQASFEHKNNQMEQKSP